MGGDSVSRALVERKTHFRPASVLALADGAFEIYRAAFGPLVTISLMANAPLFAAAAALVLYVRERGATWGSPTYFATVGALSVALALAAWIRAIGGGALAHASVTAICGRSPSAGISLRAGLAAGRRLGLLAAARWMALIGGLLACLLPAIPAVALLGFTAHAATLERAGTRRAIARSAAVAKGAAGGLTAAALLYGVGHLLGFAQLLLLVGLADGVRSLALPTGGVPWTARPEVVCLAAAVTKIFADPLTAAALGLAWVDGRIRTDGFDLELRSQRLVGEPLSIDPEAA